MKKFYMTMVAMLCGVAAMAQTTAAQHQYDYELYAEDIKLEKGTTQFDLPINLWNVEENFVTAVYFRLGFEDGFSMALNKKGKKYVTIDEDRMDGHMAMITVADDGMDCITVYDPEVLTFYETDGPVVTVPIAISEDVAAVDGQYKINVNHISITVPGEKVGAEKAQSLPTKESFDVVVTIGEGTGINSINANDSNAPIYNVAGQRVSKAQKGVFIQNGKKVAVK